MGDKIRFGTAGNPPNYKKSKYKGNVLTAPLWLSEIGLSAYELQLTHGVRTSKERAEILGENARKTDVMLSIHAPYYINLGSLKKQTLENSKKHLIDSLQVANWMNASKIVFHTGYYNDDGKESSLKCCVKNLIEIVEEAKSRGFNNISISPESAGKKKQIGSLEELIVLSECDDLVSPTIDFGHLHARDNGYLNNEENFRTALVEIEDRLGTETLRNLHCHFAPIDFNDHGEKVHKNFSDRYTAFNTDGDDPVFKNYCYKPEFLPLAKLILEFDMKPTIICECKDSQDVDALTMQRIIKNLQT